MESGHAYPERPGINWQRYARISKQKTGVRIKNNIMASTEVSRGHSKLATSSAKAGKTHKRTKDQMLEWRSKQEVYGARLQQPKHISELPV